MCEFLKADKTGFCIFYLLEIKIYVLSCHSLNGTAGRVWLLQKFKTVSGATAGVTTVGV